MSDMRQAGSMRITCGIDRPIEFETSVFSGGEVHVRLADVDRLDLRAEVHIVANLRSSNDVMALLMVTDALRRRGATRISLESPYLPYARQDRVCAPGEALALRVMCDLINAQHYESVTVYDVHSPTALALLDRVYNHEPWFLLTAIFLANTERGSDYRPPILVAPDAGALKRVAEAAKRLEMQFVRADKSRDPATGAITGTVVYSGHVGDSDFLIVDDICDGGRTFIELAKALRPLTTGKVMLYVTHGIFSRGTAVFDGLIDRVYVANSFVQPLPENFVQL